MSMSTHISGVRDLDGQFQKMIDLKNACDAADVPYPKEVKDYLQYPGESEDYLRKELSSIDIETSIRKVDDEYADIWEVDLSKLSAEVKAIRFTNSY